MMTHFGGLLSRAAGAQKREAGKTSIIGCIVAVNVMLSALSWILPDFWYVFVPFIAGACLVNSAMVVSMLGFWAVRAIRTGLGSTFRRPDVASQLEAEKQQRADGSRGIAFVVPCYNESRQEIEDTLHSLLAQKDMERHRRVFIVCCDGRVKALGAEKETSRILTEDIFAPTAAYSLLYSHQTYRKAYRTWLGDDIDIEFQCGLYHGVPYVLLIKDANRGKRDTLIMVRSLLHKYNLRADVRSTRYSAELFEEFQRVSATFGIFDYDYLVGTDADTTFAPECSRRLMATLEENENIAGVAGIVRVRFRAGSDGFWTLYQHAEYLRGQVLRRLHQSEVTRQVTCLPGACQMFRVRESTCGDAIMELFGRHPKDDDGLFSVVRAFGGEDRNHVALLFTLFPKDTTRICVGAHSYTDPPMSWKVFLSQRRRWSLSTQTNNLITIFGRGQHPWERLCSVIDIVIWLIPVFIFVTLAQVIRAFVFHRNLPLLLGLSSLIVLPWLWTLASIIWVPTDGKERLRYIVGLVLLLVCASAINLVVTAYTIWNMTDYSWGKTRALEKSEEDAATPAPLPSASATSVDCLPTLGHEQRSVFESERSFSDPQLDADSDKVWSKCARGSSPDASEEKKAQHF